MNTSVTFPVLRHPEFKINPTLGRQEAQSRLQSLTPGTEEHSKLQDALIRTSGIVKICLPNNTYKVNTASNECQLLGGFGSAEHVAIGEAVDLKGLGENKTLLDQGVNKIQFQHIVALAGDFYGVAGEAISLPGGDEVDKTKRFQKAFDTLDKADEKELHEVMSEIDNECREIKNSGAPHHCYTCQMPVTHKAIKKIKSNIEELLIDNSDHFSTNAEEAYQIGHVLAMHVAKEAGKNPGPQNLGLERAYAIDAFACHFLTDLFASGHTRNQRGDLELFLIHQFELSLQKAKTIAGILTYAQHEKDGNEGLNVYNKKGEQWRAFGDGNFFAPKNAPNKMMAIAATQASVDEIYYAYTNPESPTPNMMEELIPHATSFNPVPIYTVEDERQSLYFNHDGKKTKIEKFKDFIYALKALKYIPEGYIEGFCIDKTKDCLKKLKVPAAEYIDHPLVTMIICPVVGHFMSTIPFGSTLWGMVAPSPIHQVKKAVDKLSHKFDELSEFSRSIYDNSVKILNEIQGLKSQLNQLYWETITAPINKYIRKIGKIAHQIELHPTTIDDLEQIKLRDRLKDDYLSLSAIFHGGISEGKNVLEAYGKMLSSMSKEMRDKERKIAVTLWYRKMVEFQLQAFSLYIQFKRRTIDKPKDQLKEGEIPLQVVKQGGDYEQVAEFHKSLIIQLGKNKDFIDEELICMSQEVIYLELEKCKLIKSAQLDFIL